MAEERAGAVGPEAAIGADDLARDLPGLPFETRRLRVDERGVLVRPGLFKRWLGRREQLLPWREIVGHRWEPFQIVLERQRPDECEVHLVGAWAGRATRRRIAAAWREYVLRRIEREGCLRGTHHMVRPKLQYLALLVLGSLFLVQAAWMIAVAARHARVPGEVRASLLAAGAGFLFVAAAVALGGLREKRLVNEALLHWYRWDIVRDGVVHWPFAERVLLTAAKDDSIMSGWGRVSGTVVPFGRLTYRRVAEGLVLAGLDRAGARRPFLGWLAAGEAAVVFVLFHCALPLSLLAETIMGKLILGMPEAQPVAAFPLAAALAIAVARAWSWRRTARAVADGRAMLDRLGW